MNPVILEICRELESLNRIYGNFNNGHQRELDGINIPSDGTSYSSRCHNSKYEREYGSADEIFLKIKNVLTSPGGLVAIPTETVYGLAGNIYIEESLKRIFEIKNRPYNDPLIVHVDSFISALENLYDVNLFEAFLILYLGNRFTPGPLTMVARCKSDVSGLLTNNTGYLATRCPDNEVCRALLRFLNIPLAAPSANKFGHISPTCAEHVYDEFSNEELYILDGGQCKIGIESTVIKITTIDEPEILFKGKAFMFSSGKQYSVKNIYTGAKDAIVDLYGELNKLIINNKGRMKKNDLFLSKLQMENLIAIDAYRHGKEKAGQSKDPMYASDSGCGREDRYHEDDRYHKDRKYKKPPKFIKEFSYSNGFRYNEQEGFVRERPFEKEKNNFPRPFITLESGYTIEELYSNDLRNDNDRGSLQDLISDTVNSYRQKLSYFLDDYPNWHCEVGLDGGSTSFYKRHLIGDSILSPNASVTVGFTQIGGSTCIYLGGYTVNSILNPSNRGSTDESKNNMASGSGYSSDSDSKNAHMSKHKKSFVFGDSVSYKWAKLHGSSRRALVRYKYGKIDLYKLLQHYKNVKFKVEILRKGAVTYEHLVYALSGFENVQVCEYETNPEKESEKDTAREDKEQKEEKEEKMEIDQKQDKKVQEDLLEDKDLVESLDDYNMLERMVDDLRSGNMTFAGIKTMISSLRKLRALRTMSSVNTAAADVGSDHDDDYVSVKDFEDRISVEHLGSNDDDFMSIDDVESITGVIDNISGSLQKDVKVDSTPNRKSDSSVKENLCTDGISEACVDDTVNEDSNKLDSVPDEVGLRFEAPGMSITHYAPNVPTYLVLVTKDDRTMNGPSWDGSRGNMVCTENIEGAGVSNDTDNITGLKKVDCNNIVMIDIGYRLKSHSHMFKEYLPVINEPTSVANQLYSVLRRAESAAQQSSDGRDDAQAIIAIYFNERKIQLFSAIHDRITRSTSGNPIYLQINDQELEFSVK